MKVAMHLSISITFLLCHFILEIDYILTLCTREIDLGDIGCVEWMSLFISLISACIERMGKTKKERTQSILFEKKKKKEKSVFEIRVRRQCAVR